MIYATADITSSCSYTHWWSGCPNFCTNIHVKSRKKVLFRQWLAIAFFVCASNYCVSFVPGHPHPSACLYGQFLKFKVRSFRANNCRTSSCNLKPVKPRSRLRGRNISHILQMSNFMQMQTIYLTSPIYRYRVMVLANLFNRILDMYKSRCIRLDI